MFINLMGVRRPCTAVTHEEESDFVWPGARV